MDCRDGPHANRRAANPHWCLWLRANPTHNRPDPRNDQSRPYVFLFRDAPTSAFGRQLTIEISSVGLPPVNQILFNNHLDATGTPGTDGLMDLRGLYCWQNVEAVGQYERYAHPIAAIAKSVPYTHSFATLYGQRYTTNLGTAGAVDRIVLGEVLPPLDFIKSVGFYYLPSGGIYPTGGPTELPHQPFGRSILTLEAHTRITRFGEEYVSLIHGEGEYWI